MAVRQILKYIFSVNMIDLVQSVSITSVWLSGVLRILANSNLAFRTKVVVWFGNLGACLTLVSDLGLG